MSDFKNRIIRAAMLDANLYEEVEADKGAMSQAMGVVILSSLAAGIGGITQIGLGGIIVGTVAALIGWFIWAYLTYFIGTRFLPEAQTEADFGELLRTIGFSSAPGLLRILGFIPVLGNFIVLIASIWMLAAMIIAVRQALDYKSTLRAIGVCVIGWIVQAIIIVIMMSIFGGGAKPV